jgi:NADPH-dependent 2,4-dienoyl-CoA reductase/sulfur reductase-like enzyme
MIAIIGAGPAGLAAAKVASEIGAEVIVLDSAPRPGGQYWRHRDGVQGYKSHRASGYFDAVINSRNVTYIHGAQVWSATRNKSSITLNYLQSGVEKTITVEKLILTTGAYDRSIPFTGWELPGSMTPGAAQALLKGYGVVAGKKILVSGTGPFLLPVAVGLAEAAADE